MLHGTCFVSSDAFSSQDGSTSYRLSSYQVIPMLQAPGYTDYTDYTGYRLFLMCMKFLNNFWSFKIIFLCIVCNSIVINNVLTEMFSVFFHM